MFLRCEERKGYQVSKLFVPINLQGMTLIFYDKILPKFVLELRKIFDRVTFSSRRYELTSIVIFSPAQLT